MGVLKTGTRIQQIWWSEGKAIEDSDIITMEIVDVAGQMGFVPWVRVVEIGKDTVLFNVAGLEGITVLNSGA